MQWKAVGSFMCLQREFKLFKIEDKKVRSDECKRWVTQDALTQRVNGTVFLNFGVVQAIRSKVMSGTDQ